jgi:hypothetical protein
MAEIDIDIIILFLVIFIIGIMVGLTFKKQENIVNLDDSRKVELSKCCTDPKCYSKPPHLRTNCNKNKEDAKKELDKEFKQMYTQEEYYKKLEDLQILKKGQLNNVQINAAYADKMNERIVINPALSANTDKDIRQDDSDEVRGYDLKVLAPYSADINNKMQTKMPKL